MATFKVCGSTYQCESLGSFSRIEKHLQATIAGPDIAFCKLLQMMFNSKDKRKFKAVCFHGQYKGKFRVIEISNARVIVIKLYDLDE